MRKEKILIIKTGYSEFLDKEANLRKVSLGDVLRTTPLLHLYKNDYVTWVSDREAFPLLENNPYINRLLPLDFTTAMHLLDEEEFDTVINLEKNYDICKLSSKINAWRKYGFRYDKKTNSAQAYDRAFEVLAVGSNPQSKKENTRTVEDLLFEMVGKKWKGEEHILGYKPSTEEEYDIGLNTLVGQKWPTKAWTYKNWDILEKILTKERLNVTRQDKQDSKILKNLYDYMDWINSCKIIISQDSLGLHLGIALKKRTLGLFGPTPHKEVYFYGRGEAIIPEPIPECMPCFLPTCKMEKSCMEYITPEKVYNKVMNIFRK